MRVVVCGQKSFGAAALGAIHDAGHEVAFVVSPGVTGARVDRTAQEAARRGLPWFESLHEQSIRREESVDLIVAAHSHTFIGRRSRLATKLGGIGYHPSLLPRHRGRDAVRWTVHMGDPVAGGTVYWLSDTVDGGDVAAQDWCFVDRRWDASELWRRELFPMGIRLLLSTLKDLDNGVVVAIPQSKQFVTWEPSWERQPLHRPELPELGAMPEGYEMRRTRD